MTQLRDGMTMQESLANGIAANFEGYDLEGRPLHELAAEMKITPTRASKIRARALHRLRRGLVAA